VTRDETLLHWANRQFPLIAGNLAGNHFKQVSETTVVLIQDPPGEREITVELHADVPDPWIRILDAPKKRLLPNISEQEPEPTRVGRFDAVRIGETYYWVEKNGDGGVLAHWDVVKCILEFARSAV
jgi:hypothetical protein